MPDGIPTNTMIASVPSRVIAPSALPFDVVRLPGGEFVSAPATRIAIRPPRPTTSTPAMSPASALTPSARNAAKARSPTGALYAGRRATNERERRPRSAALQSHAAGRAMEGPPPQITPKTTDDYLEQLTKPVMQAGINWRVVDAKWKGIRKGFHNFKAERVARMSDREIDTLMKDEAVIRSRPKLYAVVHN